MNKSYFVNYRMWPHPVFFHFLQSFGDFYTYNYEKENLVWFANGWWAVNISNNWIGTLQWETQEKVLKRLHKSQKLARMFLKREF